MRPKEEIAIVQEYVDEFTKEFELSQLISEEYKSGLDLTITPSLQRAVSHLLLREERRVGDKLLKAQKKLSELKVQYPSVFEKESSECNYQFPALIKVARKFYPKESDPVAITSLVHELIEKYESTSEDISQEDKNDIYFEIHKHIQVLQKTFKK